MTCTSLRKAIDDLYKQLFLDLIYMLVQSLQNMYKVVTTYQLGLTCLAPELCGGTLHVRNIQYLESHIQ